MSSHDSTNLTLVLRAASAGDSDAVDQLLPVVYGELRQLANAFMQREGPGQTLSPTALVHDAYIRMVGGTAVTWEDRRHFFNAAAQVMRHILVDRARRKARLKHGGKAQREELDIVDIPVMTDFRLDQAAELDAALSELAEHNPRWAEIVQLRYFVGLTIDEAAQTLNISPSTVKNDWTFARAWLRAKLKAVR